MRRALIVKMWALGDILMATPLISALRTAHPGIEITWVVDESHGELLQNHPGIDDLVIIHSGQWRRMLRNANIPGWLARSSEYRNAMQSRNFDLAINCHPDKWWTSILCAAPVRVGLYPSNHLPWSRRFYTHPLGRPTGLHNTEHYLTATRAVGIPDGDLRMTLGETLEETSFIADFFRQHHLDPTRPLIVFSPFSTGENRNWENERYAAVADRLQKSRGAQIILSCSPKDTDKAEQIRSQAQSPLILATGTTLRQYIALLRRADLVLCVDSSAMHIAAAVDTPYLALFGATPVAERAPLAGRGLPMARIDGLTCAPCDCSTCTHPTFRACMKNLTVEAVATAAEKVVGRRT